MFIPLRAFRLLKKITQLCKNSRSVSFRELVGSYNKKPDLIALHCNLEYLEDHDFIELTRSKGDRNCILSITPTYNARLYKEIREQEIKEFLLKSIFTPILVAIMTSILTTIVASKLL